MSSLFAVGMGLEPMFPFGATCLANRPLYHLSNLPIAERQGFEPWVPLTRYSGFQDQCIKPLCHLSVLCSSRTLGVKVKCASSNIKGLTCGGRGGRTPKTFRFAGFQSQCSRQQSACPSVFFDIKKTLIQRNQGFSISFNSNYLLKVLTYQCSFRCSFRTRTPSGPSIYHYCFHLISKYEKKLVFLSSCFIFVVFCVFLKLFLPTF